MQYRGGFFIRNNYQKMFPLLCLHRLIAAPGGNVFRLSNLLIGTDSDIVFLPCLEFRHLQFRLSLLHCLGLRR